MLGRQGGQITGTVLALIAVFALSACGEDEVSYDDKRIIERLHLEKTGDGYAIDGDPFCEIENKLLNDAEEVDEATEKEELGLVIPSAEGNVGVKGKPPFAPDCRALAKKRLNKLDPVVKEE